MPSIQEILSVKDIKGSWTPIDSSGAGLAFAAATAGRYTRLGSLIHAFFHVLYPVTANGLQAIIGGLPFTIGNPAANSLYGGYLFYNQAAAHFYLGCAPATTTFTLTTFAGGPVANSTVSNLSFSGIVIYRTD